MKYQCPERELKKNYTRKYKRELYIGHVMQKETSFMMVDV
jgi:hypothetical protein